MIKRGLKKLLSTCMLNTLWKEYLERFGNRNDSAGFS